jgi:hypothetical protein
MCPGLLSRDCARTVRYSTVTVPGRLEDLLGFPPEFLIVSEGRCGSEEENASTMMFHVKPSGTSVRTYASGLCDQ